MHVLRASKEIVLSTGSIGTPHILMNSGIGDCSELTALGVGCKLNLPSVGKNLSDHPLLANSWFVNSNVTFEAITRNATRTALELERWNTTNSGPFVDSPLDHLAFLRLPDNSSLLQQYPDPSAGPTSAHFELVFAVCDIHPNFLFFTYLVAPLRMAL